MGDWSVRDVHSGKEGKAFFSANMLGLRGVAGAFDELTRGERCTMRKELRVANKQAIDLVIARAKELAPISSRQASRTKHLRGAIRNTSSERSVEIEVGNKTVYWGWMRHGGSTDIKWKNNRKYPPGVPFLRDAITETFSDTLEFHARAMDKVAREWNDKQRRAFAASGGKMHISGKKFIG